LCLFVCLSVCLLFSVSSFVFSCGHWMYCLTARALVV
jgi:hypothetical protein